ncbi:MAG: hypothetical protein IPK50_16585 [Fibrobacterota bacterium]|nr:MAG: hypothetical protein IPK50_16585 [Fibrobacterota bacterium]
MRTTETGHARNVTNFVELVSTCESFGSAYQPARPSLKIEGLRALRDESIAAVDAYQVANAAWCAAVVDRANAFEEFGPKITRINNAIKASESSERLDDRIALVVRRLRGARSSAAVAPQAEIAVEPTDPAVPAKKSNSVSHTAFADRLIDLGQLLKFIAEIPAYAPNEADMSLASLEAWRQDLTAKTKSVSDRQLALTAARSARDKTLYQPAKGLVDTAADTKSYIRSVYGNASSEAKHLATLNFRACA